MKFIYPILILFSMASCGSLESALTNSSNIYFIGNADSATTKIDIFFSDTMIKKKYRIMGEVGLNATNLFKSNQDIFDDYVAKAKNVGADGILFIRDINLRQMDLKYNVLREAYNDVFRKRDSLTRNQSPSPVELSRPTNNSTGLEYDYIYFIKYE